MYIKIPSDYHPVFYVIKKIKYKSKNKKIATVSSKAKGKYLKTLNIGAYKSSEGMVKDNNCVTADIYSAFGYDGREYYSVYIKTNNSNGYLYSKKDFKTLISDALSTSYYDTGVLNIVFENKTKLYYGQSLFENVLEMLPYTAYVNYGGIYNLNYLDTSGCECFDNMFEDAFSAISISKVNFYLPTTFNTANATSMNRMFMDFGYDSSNSTFTLPTSFDTSKVEDFSGIFYSLNATTLNLPEKFVIAKFNEGTPRVKSARVESMFYASEIVYINTKTPLDLRYCEDSICFSRLATLKNQKSFIDSLDFTYLNDPVLSLYCNSDKNFIDYVTNKILAEAKNLTTLRFMYTDIQADSFTLDFKNNQNITEFTNTFDSVNIKTLI